MKRLSQNQTLFFILIMVAVAFHSCRKEKSCEGCLNGNRPPNALAGLDQVITLPLDSILLDGSASNDEDGKIKAWNWKKISGPSTFHIVQPDSPKTLIKNLVMGVYTIELTVKDDAGLTAMDTLQITVNNPIQPNRPPVANAGPDLTLNLPTNLAPLNGGGSTDPDNNISTYLWRKIAGPEAYNILNKNAMQTQVSNLQQGTYEFELTVSDSAGLYTSDTTRVIVRPSSITQSLIIYFEPKSDTMVKLPAGWIPLKTPRLKLYPEVNGFSQTALATVEWSQISGPGPCNINSTTSLLPSVSGLLSGVYRFECKVTDTAGRKGSAFLLVSVSDPALPEEEIILPDLKWNSHWDLWLNVRFTIPENRSVKKIFIRQDCDLDFREVPHALNAGSGSTFIFTLIDASNLIINWDLSSGCWPASGEDSPAIKIVY